MIIQILEHNAKRRSVISSKYHLKDRKSRLGPCSESQPITTGCLPQSESEDHFYNLETQMTPIRVRGKKQNGSMKHRQAINFSPPSGSINDSMAKSAGNLSTLERLPTELLQQIFLQSLNLDLPRASLLLGSALSSLHVKILLVFKAFSSGTGYGLKHSVELLQILHTTKEVAKLQSAILRLRWMDLAFLRHCIRIFFEKTLLQLFTDHKFDWKETGPEPTKSNVVDLVAMAYQDHLVGAAQSGMLGLQQYTWNLGGPIQLDLSLGFRDGLIRFHVHAAGHHPILPCFGLSRWRLLYCLDDCQIPDKLLHGPWTDDKCDFLEVVTRGGAVIDWINSTAGEIADAGLSDAVREQNQRAVEVLVQIPIRAVRPAGYLDYGADHIHRPCDGVNYRKMPEFICTKNSSQSSVGVRPRTEHLMIAVNQPVFHKGIAKCLMTGPGSRIDKEDERIVQWALQKKISGDRHGTWLYQMLSNLEISPERGLASWNAEINFDALADQYFVDQYFPDTQENEVDEVDGINF